MGNAMGKIALFFKISATQNAMIQSFISKSKEYTNAFKNAMWVKPERKKKWT